MHDNTSGRVYNNVGGRVHNFWSRLDLALEVEAHSYFGALTRPEKVHTECDLGAYWSWNKFRCPTFSSFAFALQFGTIIASDRSWFYCSHMTWVEPCDFMKEQILFCTNVENGTALGAQNDFIFEIERWVSDQVLSLRLNTAKRLNKEIKGTQPRHIE